MTPTTDPRPPSSWRPEGRLAAVALILVTLLAYLPAVAGGSFLFDDVHHIVENPAVRPDPALVARAAAGEAPPEGERTLEQTAREPGMTGFAARCARFFVDPGTFSSERDVRMYRPVLMVTYAVDHALWGGFRGPLWVLTNVLLHATVALLVWRLALRLGLAPGAALAAGAVMALHPVFSEVVNYVSSRSESVAALLLLLAMNLHLRARGDRGDERRWPCLAAAWVAASLAVMAKETAAGFAAAVAVLELLRWRGTLQTRALRAAGWFAFYVTALLVVLWVRGQLLPAAVVNVSGRLVSAAAHADPYVGGGRSILGNLGVQARVVVLYLQFLARPVLLAADHDVSPAPGGMLSTWIACALHLGVGVWALRSALAGRRLLPLCVAWFWIFLAPSVAVPLNVIMNEHRLYLPGIAVALLAGGALGRVADLLAVRFGDRRRALTTAAAPLVLFLPMVVHRSLEWRDDLTVWKTACDRSPMSARAHLHYGAALKARAEALEGRARLEAIDRVLDAYGKSEELHPDWINLQLDLGNVWTMRALLTRADSDFERAVAAYEHMGRVAGANTFRWRMQKAGTLLLWGRHREALSIVTELDAEDTTATPIYDDLRARILRKLGDAEGARQSMELVVDRVGEPDRVDPLLTLGWWRFEDAVALHAAGAPRRQVDDALTESEARITEALTIGKRYGNFRPNLYVARFLFLQGQEGWQEFVDSAVKAGWRPDLHPRELAWVKGGRTPHVATGTVGRGR